MLRAWSIVAPDAPLVALVSTLQVAGTAGLYPEITVPLLLASLPVTIVLYGRVLARLVPSEPRGAGAILGLHAFDWLVVTVLVAVPLLAVRLLLVTLRAPVAVWFGAGIMAKAAVWTATMYAMPLAFLARRSLAALVGGIAFLRRHRAESRWIAWTILAIAATATAGSWLYRLDTAPWSFTLAVVAGVATGLLNFMVFAGALGNLVEAGVDRETITRGGQR
jgi:hypothetical protein